MINGVTRPVTAAQLYSFTCSVRAGPTEILTHAPCTALHNFGADVVGAVVRGLVLRGGLPVRSRNQGVLASLAGPDSKNQSRASATMTQSGPPPAGPSVCTAGPPEANVPAHEPSGRRVKDSWVPGG